MSEHTSEPWSFTEAGRISFNNLTFYISAESDQLNGGFFIALVQGADKECSDDERSQHANKAKAMELLKGKLEAIGYDQIAKLRQRAQENEGMAECMDMTRRGLIDAGLIDESVPPMFVAEAVLSYIAKLQMQNGDHQMAISALEGDVAELEKRIKELEAGQPVAPDWYQNPTSEGWFELPDDADVLESLCTDLSVGDEYELDVCWNGKQTFRVTKIADSTSDDLEVEFVRGTKYFTAPPTINAAVAAVLMEAAEVCKYPVIADRVAIGDATIDGYIGACKYIEKAIRSLPHDEYALVEFGMKVAEAVNMHGATRSHPQGQLVQIVQRIIKGE